MSEARQASRILVVDDEPMVAELIVEMLTDADYSVVGPYFHLTEALRAAEIQDFDAALLDINLAGRPSQPIAEVLTRRHIPFMFLTGYGTAPRLAADVKAPVIGKPFDPEDLFCALTQILTPSPVV